MPMDDGQLRTDSLILFMVRVPLREAEKSGIINPVEPDTVILQTIDSFARLSVTCHFVACSLAHREY